MSSIKIEVESNNDFILGNLSASESENAENRRYVTKLMSHSHEYVFRTGNSLPVMLIGIEIYNKISCVSSFNLVFRKMPIDRDYPSILGVIFGISIYDDFEKLNGPYDIEIFKDEQELYKKYKPIVIFKNRIRKLKDILDD